MGKLRTTRRQFIHDSFAIGAGGLILPMASNTTGEVGVIHLNGEKTTNQFDGIGVVNGGGATSVLLKDYPEPQRSQILDLVFKPKFGASVSALLVEIPGDGNSTQGSMLSHMHTPDDLDCSRGYIWWLLCEAKKRNHALSLDANIWSVPGWIENFWSQNSVDYCIKWLQGLKNVHGLELDAMGCRNEKGVNYGYVEKLRMALNANGFAKLKVHAFDNWPANKLDFVKDMFSSEKLRRAIDVISAHTFSRNSVPEDVRSMATKMGKPIWNTEEHIYEKGFDCAIDIVKAFNDNFIVSGATKILNWYDVAALYPLEPYSLDPSMLLAYWPWSGHYEVREALWGYAHYGQFTQIGWRYLEGGCGDLPEGGSFVALKSKGSDYSIVIETKGSKISQKLRFQIGGGLSPKKLCFWFSNAQEQFVQLPDIAPANGSFVITLQPNSIYSLSTTRGQQKGSFDSIPEVEPFPFPYHETFDAYSDPKEWGYLPRYTADIDGAFEITNMPDGPGKCLRQVAPSRPNSWAPDWLPYSIIGDDLWQDYEVSADIYLNPADSAGVMGRVNAVGSGFGCIPRGYFLQLRDDGQCTLVVVRGRKDKKKVVGDAEQQALIKAEEDPSEGGEKILGAHQVSNIGPHRWYNLKLRFLGSAITGLVDNQIVVTATDALYSHGAAGVIAGAEDRRFSTPFFNNLLINRLNGVLPEPTKPVKNQLPIYGRSLQQDGVRTRPMR